MPMIISFAVLLVVTFLVMIVFMNKMVHRDLGSATAHLDQMAAEYTRKEQEIQRQLEEVKRHGQQIVETAHQDAEQQKQRMLKEVQEQKEKLLAEAHQKIEELMQETDRARKALLNEADQKIEERAVERAVGFLQAILPEQVRFKIHEPWIDDLIASSFAQLERLHIPEGVKEARIVSAFALTDEQRQALLEKLKEKLGFQVNLKEEVDANIIAGWTVSIGDLMLDGSLRFKIQEAVIAHQK